jgi:adenylate cyclase
VGTIGTKKRMDATVIGDNVNIAARLQSLTRKHKKNIITSQSTIDLIQDKTQFSLHSLGEEILTGKEYPVVIWSVDETNKKS